MQTTKKYLTRRYILFFVSVFINAYGIAFITRALLGTSPITSVNYVLSMITPLTMGQWTILMNAFFILCDLLLMTREQLRAELRMYLLQIPITLCFGTFIDISMNSLSWLAPDAYFFKFISMLAGCVILAVGITLEVKADVAMVAGEFFVRVLARKIKGDFGYVKLGFDIANVLVACIFSWIFLDGIKGVREGTVAAALLVGPIVHFLTPYTRVLDSLLGYSGKAVAKAMATSKHIVVTIARELGSGGHRLGEMLASKLGVKLYDREFIKMAARDSGINEDYIKKNEQNIPDFWLKCILSQGYGSHAGRGLSDDDVLFLAESKIVDTLAEKEPCVIVGRCADFVLRDFRGVVRVFCCSDEQTAVERCSEEYKMDSVKALNEIRRTNRARATHYEYYTGQKWDDPHHYDVVVNTARISLEDACDMIVGVCKKAEHEINAMAKASGAKA